jgi:hypothetical protein
MTDKPEYKLPKQNNYDIAHKMAVEKLKAMDFDGQCEKSGVKIIDSGAEVEFIDRKYLVNREGFEVTSADKGPGPELWEEIVILHYLITADGSGPTGDLISYKQVPDGAPYVAVFNRRTSEILLSVFDDRLPALIETAKRIGAHEVSGHGDLAFKIRALPKVEYLFVIYQADPEFPAEIKILFDSSIQNHLPAEDITVLCQMICIKIVKSQ